MARLDPAAQGRMPLPSRKFGKDCSGAVLDGDEKRAAAPVDDDDYSVDECDDERVDDDKSVAVLSRDELEAFDADSDAQLLERLALAIQDLREQDDWLVQHEATATLRRVVVHHAHTIDTRHVDAFLDHVVRGCDNLRSALSKNSLLALAECFECLGATHAQRFLSHGALLDVLLRRASCEKQFLREAAAFAVQQLAAHLASWQLIASAGAYAKAKHGRLCGNAARIVSASLLRLQSDRSGGAVARILELDDGTHMRAICHTLAGFYGAKDKRARLEAAAAFKVLGHELGHERFERVVKSSLKDPLAAARIVKDVFPPAVDAAAHSKTRRGSLRERILLEAAATTT